VFAYHKKFWGEGVEQTEADCRGGKLGCVAHKKEVARKIADYLTPIREKRLHFESHKREVEEIIREGDRKAREVARATMEEVREAMQMG